MSAWTWEIIQSLAGLCLLPFLKRKIIKKYKDRYIVWYDDNGFLSGVSLGFWICLPKNASSVTVAHEYGHCVQSKRWGPLYLFVIGLPSLLNNLRSRYDDKIKTEYYNLYPEKQADALGGVVWSEGKRITRTYA